MADAAVGFLLEQVKGVIKGYADLISGAGKEFKSLKDDVETLKATLKDIANKSSDEHRAKEIQKQLREAVYEVEDTIDSWLTQAAALKANCFKRYFIWLCPNHIGLANQVKTLRQNVVMKMLGNVRTEIGPVGTGKEELAKDEMRTSLPIRQDRIVRLMETEDHIISLLTTDEEELDIIPLIGMPGLGKTTLAWKIFEHEHIRAVFGIRIWVHFSQRFDGRAVLLQIMKHFSSNNLSSESNQELSRAVYAFLNREKFLLVMDGVWEMEHWDFVKNALPYGNNKGKVLITSCDMQVGRHVKHITNPISMRFLMDQESWQLLQLEVFGKLESCPEDLQKIGEYIATQCKGVPLTIVVIGGVLKDSYLSLGPLNKVYEKWEDIANNVHRQLHSDNKKKAISDVLAFSYNGLPEHLRECFLYLGVFPAGYEIPARTLMCLWIAEGFIQPEDSRSLEEIAEENLNDLVSRNLLMVHKMNPVGKVKFCYVQDMIRVFCILEAEKQNLFKEVLMRKKHNDDLQIPDMENVHRLCLHSDLDEFFSAELKGPRVRSILCFSKDVMDLESKFNTVNYLLLRVLHSNSIKFNQFPQNIAKLNHLRYIVLCVADLKKLPQSLSQLWNLQTITVDTNSDSLIMEANIWKMIQLRHVRTKASIFLDKAWDGEASKNLQTLNRLSPESVTQAVSEKASNLKTLGIRGNLAPLFKDMPLRNMNRLVKLKLYHAAASSEKLHHFPDHGHFPSNLKRLTLSKTFLDWKHMSTLAIIPGLEVLKLKENAFTGISWEAQNQTFNNLQALQILNSDLVIWKASDKTFPCLTHLELKKCENLKEIPDGIQKLENLDIARVRKSIAYSAMNMALHQFNHADLI